MQAPRPPRPRAILLALAERDYVADAAAQLRPHIDQHIDVVLYDDTFAIPLDNCPAEMTIVMGGDGSILRAVRLMGYRQIPVLGVNMGKLGFLADLSPDRFLALLPTIAAGGCRVVHHLMYQCQLLRDGQPILDKLGLNEVAVLAGPPFNILEVDLHVDGELVTTYSCDGLIISTPVGSTAHNLSAGGPILRKSLQAFVISPISPHTLTNRPVVDSAQCIYEMVVESPNPDAALVADGQVLATLQPGDRVRVQRAAPTFQLLEAPGQSYYRTLREKLGWGGTLHNGRSVR